MKIKALLASIMMLFMGTVSYAQKVNIPEPEFINSYYLLTSDSTFAELPKENGTVKKHTSLASKIGKIASKAADVASAAGGIGAITSNSVSGVIDGVRVMGTAANVGSAADAITNLSFAEGMDIVFENGHSSYVTTLNKDVRIVINNGNIDNDPRDMYRIVRLNASKKDRKVRWQTITPSMFGTSQAEKIGYANFSGHRYGNQSYIITLPASEAQPGEYGIFYMGLAQATEIPVATFSIQ